MERMRSDLIAAVPDGWLVRESVELVAPEQDSYVAASVEAVGAEMTPDRVAEQYETVLEGRLPGYEQIESRTVELSGGRHALVRKVRWTASGDEPVIELQLYWVRGGRALVATARAPETSFDERKLMEVLVAVELAGPSPSGSILRRDESARTRTADALEAGTLTTTVAEAFELAATRPDGDAETAADSGAVWEEVRTSWQAARVNK